jgi:hypothetical protein
MAPGLEPNAQSGDAQSNQKSCNRNPPASIIGLRELYSKAALPFDG